MPDARSHKEKASEIYHYIRTNGPCPLSDVAFACLVDHGTVRDFVRLHWGTLFACYYTPRTGVRRWRVLPEKATTP